MSASRRRYQVDEPRHSHQCLFYRAVMCTTPIACEHGYDVCPECDPCTCNSSQRIRKVAESLGVPRALVGRSHP